MATATATATVTTTVVAVSEAQVATVAAITGTGKTAAGPARVITALAFRVTEIMVPRSFARKTAKTTLAMEKMER